MSDLNSEQLHSVVEVVQVEDARDKVWKCVISGKEITSLVRPNFYGIDAYKGIYNPDDGVITNIGVIHNRIMKEYFKASIEVRSQLAEDARGATGTLRKRVRSLLKGQNLTRLIPHLNKKGEIWLKSTETTLKVGEYEAWQAFCQDLRGYFERDEKARPPLGEMRTLDPMETRDNEVQRLVNLFFIRWNVSSGNVPDGTVSSD